MSGLGMLLLVVVLGAPDVLVALVVVASVALVAVVVVVIVAVVVAEASGSWSEQPALVRSVRTRTAVAAWMRMSVSIRPWFAPDTAETIRTATESESTASIAAAETDGGAGVILVDGRSCYVSNE